MLQKNKLDFSDFFSIPSNEWKRKILEELKSNSEEILVKRSETLATKGFYAFDDIQNLTYLQRFHQRFQVKLPRHWYTAEYLSKPVLAPVPELLNSGVDALFLDQFLNKNHADYLQKITSTIPLSYTPLYIRSDSPLKDLFKDINMLSEMKGCYFRKTSIETYPHSKDSLISEHIQSLMLFSDIPRFKVLGIDTTYIHSATNNPVKEITYAITLFLDLFDGMTDLQISPVEVLSNVSFSFTIGRNYFLEIAKLRAFRVVWEMVVNNCDPQFDSLATPIVCTTDANSFSDDPYYNILHNTTEAMAAIIGGCDALAIIPFDHKSKDQNSFSSRISRNISLILKEESYMNYVADPLGGSYLLESLTDQIANQALEMIKAIEQHGGLAITMKGGKSL